jgi:hypothetical protein
VLPVVPVVNNPTSSIVWSLKRLFDKPADVEREVRDRHAELRGERKTDADPPTYRCRVCSLESPDGTFCPECLADTMVEVERER